MSRLLKEIDRMVAVERTRQQIQPRRAPRRVFIPTEEPKAMPSPKTAMGRLQKTFRSREYNSATMKVKSRIAGAPAPQLTPAERRALESAQRDYRVARVGEPQRQDRDFQGIPKTPAGVRTGNRKFLTEQLIRIAQLPADERPHVAANARSNIFADPKHPYWHADHPDHQTAVVEMEELTKMEMDLNKE